MAWSFDNSRPIYLQLMQRIELMILSGEYKAGEQLPPVRELANIAAVNPNTLQKAFAELENTGLIYTQRTAGRYITEDTDMINSLRESLAQQETDQFLHNMNKLGLDTNACIKRLQQNKED